MLDITYLSALEAGLHIHLTSNMTSLDDGGWS